jgi:hypothetical protein
MLRSDEAVLVRCRATRPDDQLVAGGDPGAGRVGVDAAVAGVTAILTAAVASARR